MARLVSLVSRFVNFLKDFCIIHCYNVIHGIIVAFHPLMMGANIVFFFFWLKMDRFFIVE